MLISSAAVLRGTPRPTVADANQASAASQTSPDLTRMEEVVQSYLSEKKFMAVYWWFAEKRVTQQGLRLRQPRVGHTELTLSEVPVGIDHQAIHCCLDPAPGGARETEGV